MAIIYCNSHRRTAIVRADWQKKCVLFSHEIEETGLASHLMLEDKQINKSRLDILNEKKNRNGSPLVVVIVIGLRRHCRRSWIFPRFRILLRGAR